MSAKCPGPAHDSVAFYSSSYYSLLQNIELSRGYWVAADCAYVCDDSTITPLPIEHASSGTAGDAFNFFLSSHLMHIVKSLSMLMSRWVILWRPLQITLANNIRVVQLAMCLHNFCIGLAGRSPGYFMSDVSFHQIEGYMHSLISHNIDSRTTSSFPGQITQVNCLNE